MQVQDMRAVPLARARALRELYEFPEISAVDIRSYREAEVAKVPYDRIRYKLINNLSARAAIEFFGYVGGGVIAFISAFVCWIAVEIGATTLMYAAGATTVAGIALVAGTYYFIWYMKIKVPAYWLGQNWKDFLGTDESARMPESVRGFVHQMHSAYGSSIQVYVETLEQGTAILDPILRIELKINGTRTTHYGPVWKNGKIVQV